MTDRLHGFIIHLEKDIREDAAQATLEAILHIKGVIDITPVVVDHNTIMARSRAKHEIVEKLLALVKELNSR